MSVSLSPVWSGTQFFDENGNPLAGGKIYSYENGSFSVQQTTYDDEAGTVPNSNPMILDSSGRISNGLFLTNGLVYNLVLTTDDDTIITSVDGVVGVGGGGATGNGVWIPITGTTVEYVSSTSFRVLGNYTTEFSVGNRVQVEFTSSPAVYGTVTSRTFDGTYTQVVLTLDSGIIVNDIDTVYHSAIDVNSKPGDAGAISWTLPASYTDPKTVGYQIISTNGNVTNVNNRVTSVRTVHSTSGGPAYTLTITPSFNSYTNDQVFTIKFVTNNGGNATTLNINGIGAVSVFSYDSTGATVDPVITNNMVSDVIYNGTSFILLDTIPGATPSPTFPSRGLTVVNSNGTFTVPANVTFLEVTCVGGGGGGGTGSAQVNESGIIDYYGGTGGAGAIAVKGVTVTAGATYNITVGAGGLPNASGGITVFGNDLCKAGGGSAGANATPFGPGAGGATGSLLVYDYGITPPQIITSGLRGAGGVGGLGLLVIGSAGTAGTCIVKW